MLEKVFHHKLLKDGERGRGVITERRDQAAESSASHSSTLFEVHGHIKFSDGTEAGFSSEMLNSRKVGSLQEGAIVPVRYDPSDHSKVVLDIPALEDQERARMEQDQAFLEERKQQRIADADAHVGPGNEPGLSGS
jgi:hypothetical protein